MRPLTRASLGLLALAATAPAANAGVATAIVARQMAAKPAATAPAANAPATANAPAPATANPAAATGLPVDPATRAATICPGCLQKASASNGRIPMPPSGARIGEVCAACQVEAQIADEEAAESGHAAPAPAAPPAPATYYVPAPMTARPMPTRGVARVTTAPVQAFPPGTVFMVEGPPAGYAVVGGAPAPAVASSGMLRAPGAGYAVVGGQPAPAVASGPVGEPVPIGVVQAGYRAMPAGMATATPAGYTQAMDRPGMPMPNPAAPGYAQAPAPGSSPIAPLPGPPPKRGSNFMRHLFYNVPSFSHMAQDNHERQTRESHAMVSYGPNGQPPADLPAAMVYGR